MNEIQDGLKYLFQTSSKYVLLISGTGHAGELTFPKSSCKYQFFCCHVSGICSYMHCTEVLPVLEGRGYGRYGSGNCKYAGAW
jgi:hypothetical protein